MNAGDLERAISYIGWRAMVTSVMGSVMVRGHGTPLVAGVTGEKCNFGMILQFATAARSVLGCMLHSTTSAFLFPGCGGFPLASYGGV